MGLKSKLLWGYILAVILYALFILLPAPSPAILLHYHLRPTGLRAIDVTIIVLQAVIWFAGFYGYASLRKYTAFVRRDKDGKQVASITNGILLLVLWLPVTAVISAILAYIGAHHLNLLAAFKIINNYLSLIFPLAGFVFIGKGARGLSELAKQRPSFLATNVLSFALIYAGLIYLKLVATTANRNQVYHMNIWLIVLTLVAPYVYMWFIGLLSTYEIYNYRRRVAGVVYRKSWGLLALGLGWMIVMSMSVQYLTTLTAWLNHLSIYWLLVVVYSVLLVYSVGFVLIALGARKLQKIEEV